MADDWHFHCPECGFGHGEHGRLAQDQEFYCEVCLEESNLTIRLLRWLPETIDQARFRRAA
jgi:hypothetical protein